MYDEFSSEHTFQEFQTETGRIGAVRVRQIKLSKSDVFAYIAGDDATRTCALIDPAFALTAWIRCRLHLICCVIPGHDIHVAVRTPGG